MKCANGQATGVGVNLTTRSRDVIVYFEGGGACWDALTCRKLQLSINIANGYGKTEFDNDFQRSMLPLLRSEPQNPFREFNYVFIPYCTGDLHVGDNVVDQIVDGGDGGADAGGTFETHFVGARNVQAALARIVATFRDAGQVWIGGDSAGGYASLMNFWRFNEAFPSSFRGVVDDSGQPIQPRAELWSAWKNAWNFHAPPGCSECDARLSAYLDHNHGISPNTRFGLLSYADDPSISSYFGITDEELARFAAGGVNTATRIGYSVEEFAAQLADVEHRMEALGPSYRYLIQPGASHIVLLDRRVINPFAPPPAPELWQWLQRMYGGASDWVNVTP